MRIEKKGGGGAVLLWWYIVVQVSTGSGKFDIKFFKKIIIHNLYVSKEYNNKQTRKCTM